ncbi:MAG: MmcQ/YjbR family DNA-binding protein [Deltaproteobacteria bacterium]|nr:MmcQ/YjbR family DNA-binding protein [Deltaproteobacteria bacterium]
MTSLARVHRQLRRAALALPEAYEDSPWGEPVFKVRKKIFLFLGRASSGFYMSVKLPETSGVALMLPNVEPTGYNLGRSGWVSATFDASQTPPLKMLLAWIEESYRAVAPRRLVAGLQAIKPAARKAQPKRRRSQRS